MKKTKQALFHSVIALLLCFSMLIGTTFAWFSDSITSTNNLIVAGNLDVELEYMDQKGNWKPVNDRTNVFEKDTLWEPGHTEVVYLRVTNKGDLALKYQLGVNIASETGSFNVNGRSFKLSDYIKFGAVEDVTEQYASRAAARAAVKDPKLISAGYSKESSLEAGDPADYVALVVYMPEDVGNEANYATGQTPPSIDLGITLMATQYTSEQDSFGPDYDEGARFPALQPGSVSVNVTPDASGYLTEDVQMLNSAGTLVATVPAGVKVGSGVTKLTLSVSEMSASNTNITLQENEILRSLDVHIEGVAADNTQPIIITISKAMMTGLNMGNYTLYHVENGVTNTMTYVNASTKLDAHNEFTYDPATGDVTLAMATFSEVAVVADTENAWNGTATAFAGGTGTKDDPYIIANADQLAYMGDRVSNDNTNYGSAYYKLISDINIGGKENYNTNGREVLWYPIGYNKVGGTTTDKGNWYTYGGAFSGTFDGTGHTITGIYQNTWAMVGDYSGTYYNDAMGLFGYVNGGTVKNLTIDNFYSEGEFAPTGCVAAYAAGEATFENIAITNSHPQTYNTGVAGIVGWDEGDASSFTFKNITVDSTNTISALWGSWDVAAAGLLGYLGPNSKANLENCHVSATIDVYNDVCGNYQYYWYRYCGMMIGTVDKRLDNGKGALDLSNITATNCTVNFGDRHEYYYCEFVENTIASYTHDYQMSRVDNEDIVGSGDSATCQNHNHEEHGYETVNGNSVLVEDKQAVYIPFRQLFGGYGWGVDGVDLGEYDNIEISDITYAQEKFETKFTGDFLYRVGNQNTVSLGSLFAAKEGATINSSGVYVTIDKINANMNVSGTFTANTSDWTKGTIQFSGTGVVKVTIQDYNYCAPTVLYLEVVDAVNATSATSATKNNVVLLNDVTNGSFSVSAPYGFYGNGFTITLNPSSHSATKGNGYTGYITMNGGILDNVRIDGPVFAESNIYQSQALPSGTTNSESIADYFKNAVIVIGGNPTISNSYISGARTAVCVKAGGNVVIENTRLSGGAYANIEVLSANSLELKNVTTEQKEVTDSYGANKNVIGTGVVINNAETKLILDGLTQYNWMTQVQWEGMLGSYTSAFPKLFDNSYSNLQYSNNGTTYVNTGIIWACEVTNPNIEGEIDGYDVTPVKVGTVNGVVYTKTKNSGDSDDLTNEDIAAPDYESSAQGAVPPTATFDYTSKNNEPEQSGFNDYCYYNTDSKKFMISFDEGESKNWYSDILTVTKGTAELPYTVTVSSEATVNADGTITFSKAGDYTVTYTYTDTYNYKQINGELVTYEKTYYQYVYVTIFVVEPESDPTTFAFGDNGYKTVTAGGLTYAMPDVTATKDPTKSSNVVTDSGIGSKTIDGETIYYPIIGMHKVGSSMSYYNYFSIFEAVTINDANGTSVYNTNTTSLPSNLQVIGGFIDNGTESANGTAIFNYSTGKTIKTKSVTVKGTSVGLCYYPDSSFSSSTTARAEQTIVVKYCYTDTNGKAYYYYIGYWCAQGTNGIESSTSGSCLAAGSMITLADGSKKAVEELRKGDIVMAFDHITGEIVNKDVVIVGKTYADCYYKNVFIFDDGTELATINEHGIYDLDIRAYVNIDHNNYHQYLGHRFASVDSHGNIGVKRLVDVITTCESGYKYDIVTNETLNYVVEDTLSVSHEIVTIMNSFAFADNMRYDAEAMKADIEKYGLYTYEDFATYCEREVFEQYNMAMMKVGVGKGLYTKEHLVYLLTEIALNNDVQITD